MLLAECGLRTIDELAQLGAVKAYLRAMQVRPRGTSLNLLWALAAGLEDRDWRDLSADEKSALLTAVRKARR